MSIRMLVLSYAFTLFVAMLGCAAIARSRHASRGMWWIVGTLASAMTATLLFAGIDVLPVFFTTVLANEAVLIAVILLHQAVAATLESPRRYAVLGAMLALGQFLLYLHYTYAVPDMRARVVVRNAAIVIQVAATVYVLFRHKDRSLQFPARAVGWLFAGFGLLQASQLAADCVWAPTLDRLAPDPLQAFFNLFNFMTGMGCWAGAVWLAMSAQRQDLHVMATTDGLSGLMNRTAFDEALAREFRRRKSRPLALLLIDLDHFKAVNDEHGHPVGDEVIRRVSRLLHENVRPMDSVARYGGEEFAVLLRGMNFAQAEAIAERLRALIAAMPGLPTSVGVTASFGIGIRRETDTAESLFKRCDEALYLSKHLGRNRVSAMEFAFEEP